nr:MAG TPA: hypothetical protein [Caudoviricetes sp.]
MVIVSRIQTILILRCYDYLLELNTLRVFEWLQLK